MPEKDKVVGVRKKCVVRTATCHAMMKDGDVEVIVPGVTRERWTFEGFGPHGEDEEVEFIALTGEWRDRFEKMLEEELEVVWPGW